MKSVDQTLKKTLRLKCTKDASCIDVNFKKRFLKILLSTYQDIQPKRSPGPRRRFRVGRRWHQSRWRVGRQSHPGKSRFHLNDFNSVRIDSLILYVKLFNMMKISYHRKCHQHRALKEGLGAFERCHRKQHRNQHQKRLVRRRCAVGRKWNHQTVSEKSHQSNLL
jgi:hypothetical protein